MDEFADHMVRMMGAPQTHSRHHDASLSVDLVSRLRSIATRDDVPGDPPAQRHTAMLAVAGFRLGLLTGLYPSSRSWRVLAVRALNDQIPALAGTDGPSRVLGHPGSCVTALRDPRADLVPQAAVARLRALSPLTMTPPELVPRPAWILALALDGLELAAAEHPDSPPTLPRQSVRALASRAHRLTHEQTEGDAHGQR